MARSKAINPFVVLIAVVSLGVAIASSDQGDSGSSGDSKNETTETTAGAADEVDDVTVAACTKDELSGWPKATLNVTNNSEKPSDYLIEVTFESTDGATQVGTGNTIISNLAPGQSKTEEVSAFEEATVEFTCKVTKVDRSESL